MVCVLCTCACGCERVDGVCPCLQYKHLCCEVRESYVVYLHMHVCIWVPGFWVKGVCG